MVVSAQVSWLESGEETVRVRWADGTFSVLPYLWLRDNCGCDACRVPQTGEKRFMLSDVPAGLKPDQVELCDDELRIVWPGGHATAYSGKLVRVLQAPVPEQMTHWASDFAPRRVNFPAFLDDDAVAAATIDAFLEFGAVILSAAPTVPGTLEQLAPRLGPLRELLFARIHDVAVDPSGYNVAHTPMALPPHNDFASYSWPPSVQALHMLVNDVPGGESVIVDGLRVVKSMRAEQPQLVDALCRTAVPFREFDDDNETAASAPLVTLDSDGEVAALRFSNQLMQPIPPREAGLAAFYRAYHELCRRLTDASAQARFRLGAGDVLLVASHRVLHGRDAFEPVGRRQLQDAYFEFDNVRNHRVVLARKGVSVDG